MTKCESNGDAQGFDVKKARPGVHAPNVSQGLVISLSAQFFNVRACENFTHFNDADSGLKCLEGHRS